MSPNKGGGLESCNKCGLCYVACPIGRELYLERFTPRGRIQLKRAYENGELVIDPILKDVYSTCLLCGACQEVCPSGVNTKELIMEMRAEISRVTKTEAPLSNLLSNIEEFGNIAGEDNTERSDWVEEEEFLIKKGKSEFIYFVGCVSSFYPTVQNIPLYLSRIMKRSQIDFIILGSDEYCCGFPLILEGLWNEFDRLKEHNLEIIKNMEAKNILFSCPSCLTTWRRYYDIDIPLIHHTQLLKELVDDGRIRFKGVELRVIYHDPCDLGREGHIYDAPRYILSSIPGITLLEFERTKALSYCCGGGGNLESTHPELSRRIAENRIDEAIGLGAEIILSACPQCVRTLKSSSIKGKKDIKVMELTEFIYPLISYP